MGDLKDKINKKTTTNVWNQNAYDIPKILS